MLTFAMSDAVLYSYNQEITGEVRLSPIRPECYREIEENAPYQRVQQGLRGKEFSDKLKVGVAYASPSFVEHCEVFFVVWMPAVWICFCLHLGCSLNHGLRRRRIRAFHLEACTQLVRVSPRRVVSMRTCGC
jgi:hypothetical protein